MLLLSQYSRPIACCLLSLTCAVNQLPRSSTFYYVTSPFLCDRPDSAPFFYGCMEMTSSPPIYTLGIESSANKLGIALLTSTGAILSNRRKTYITPPGTGFLPKETAQHHAQHCVQLTIDVLREARKNEQLENVQQVVERIGGIAFTKGPGMGGPLQIGAILARTLCIMWKKQIIPVNHCVGRK